jgi:hypothetical protein
VTTAIGCSLWAVSEQQDVISRLGGAGILEAVRWAYASATTRSLETYSESDGHDAAWLGNTRFTLFRDRLDRVFACERYAVHSGDSHADLDLLFEALSEHDRVTMPGVLAGAVVRSNLNGSPGWVFSSMRLLLAAGAYGKLDLLPWPQKSETKKQVARQRNPEPPQPSLFEGFAPEEIGGLEGLVPVGEEPDLETYVVAHSLDAMSGQYELILGRPRLNSGGGQAWYWRQDLLGSQHGDGVRRMDDARVQVGPNAVADAPVRLRRPEERSAGNTSGRP